MKKIKFGIALIVVLVLRFVPHPANFEPITATLMPYSRRMSVWVSVAMAFLSIFLYDIISGSFGVWSTFTAGSYMLLAWFFAWVLRGKANGIDASMDGGCPVQHSPRRMEKG